MSYRRSDLKTIVYTLLSPLADVRAYKSHPKAMSGAGVHAFITIPDADESAATMSRGVGRKKVEYTVRLVCFSIDTKKDVEVGEAAFEAKIDEIIETIRANPQPSGDILAFGVERIRSRISEPRLTGDQESNVFRGAVVEFPVVVHVVG